MKTNLISKDEQKMFPKIFTIRYFKIGSDIRDRWNEMYAIEKIAYDFFDETKIYETLNYEANLSIEIKLPNGLIK
jgi:hypothetical protein